MARDVCKSAKKLDQKSRMEESPESVNPLKFHLKLTKWQLVRSTLFGIILVPLRIILVTLLIVCAWTYALLRVYILTGCLMPNDGVTKGERRLYSVIFKLIAWTCGFYVIVKGQPCPVNDSRIFVVAPHSTFFDIPLLMGWLEVPCTVSKESNFQIPILSTLLRLCFSLSVPNEPSERMSSFKDLIGDWVESHKSGNHTERDRKLAVFPEGFCGNRKALLPFRTGSFRCGQPVQPVLFRYENDLDTVTWTYHQSVDGFAIFLLTLSQPYTKVCVEFLPVFTPLHEDKLDAKVFARNVQLKSANALKIPASQISYKCWKSGCHDEDNQH